MRGRDGEVGLPEGVLDQRCQGLRGEFAGGGGGVGELCGGGVWGEDGFGGGVGGGCGGGGEGEALARFGDWASLGVRLEVGG